MVFVLVAGPGKSPSLSQLARRSLWGSCAQRAANHTHTLALNTAAIERGTGARVHDGESGRHSVAMPRQQGTATAPDGRDEDEGANGVGATQGTLVAWARPALPGSRGPKAVRREPRRGSKLFCQRRRDCEVDSASLLQVCLSRALEPRRRTHIDASTLPCPFARSQKYVSRFSRPIAPPSCALPLLPLVAPCT
ncbi:uncharacterized protein CC84DRAFT_522536 [Paraphaeosphaeria sporulosa]|uniref:Uncharacterized protein n=1 Tax=Paraphaeosphaeria sporulosa TaxID=1460663 RepID=A0A177CMB8_9PLEO|nr:uncharacterized protein CC84DRAFT_522536 [Paraphaeosphaeria sporulosa]OAG07907.1 hypothetical protein CC84DRAFT_522536 [Paraphaeosphaeria sporulosa]